MNNFVDVIAEYDKGQERRWRFIVFTIVVFSVAGIYLLGVIVERYSTPRFPPIVGIIEMTDESSPEEIESMASPSEESPIASESPIEESPVASESPSEEGPVATIQAGPTLNPIFAQATEHALSIQGATGGGP